FFSFFFLHDSAVTVIFTLSLHDALPIYLLSYLILWEFFGKPHPISIFFRIHKKITLKKQKSKMFIYICILFFCYETQLHCFYLPDRKSTRLNSSHVKISYAVFCLKKKKK